MTKETIPLLLVSLLAGAVTGRGQQDGSVEATFTLEWPANGVGARPVHVDLGDDLPPGAQFEVDCASGTGTTTIPAQRDPAKANRLWWIASPPDNGADTEITVRVCADNRKPGAVAVKGREAVQIRIADKPVLNYRYTPMPPPEGKSALYTRSGFVHPLYSPAGEVLTAIHPPDHIHHMGLWNPWTSTEFEGRHVDFWNLHKGQGTVRFVRFESVASGPVFAGFRAQHHHVDLKAPGGEKPVLEETWDVKVWDWKQDSFLIDLQISQTCIAESPLHLNAYRYGGLVFRGRLGWHTSNSGYLTSKGKTRSDGHASRARWCHAYGDTPKGGAGVLFMSHPENREHPEPMRLWPNRANGGKNNLFFNFCPVQKKPWTMKPGKTYTLRYRINVYTGHPNQQDAEALWRAFAKPPISRR